MERAAFLSKLPLEIGTDDFMLAGGFRSIERRLLKEPRMACSVIFVPRPEIIVIGHQPQLAAGLQHSV